MEITTKLFRNDVCSGHVIDAGTFSQALNDYINNMKSGCTWGEISHEPEDGYMGFRNISHKINKVDVDGEGVNVTIDIMDLTPNGKIVKQMLDSGYTFESTPGMRLVPKMTGRLVDVVDQDGNPSGIREWAVDEIQSFDIEVVH